MSSSASSGARSGPLQVSLPLVPCPLCGHEIITFICRRGTRPGVRFYKCIHYSDGVCPFFEWQETYAAALEGYQQLAAEEQPHQPNNQADPIVAGAATHQQNNQAAPLVAGEAVADAHPTQGVQGHPIGGAPADIDSIGDSRSAAPYVAEEEQKPMVGAEDGPVHRHKITCACSPPHNYHDSTMSADRGIHLGTINLILSAMNLLLTVILLGIVLGCFG